MNRQEALSFLDKCKQWFEPYTGDPEKWHEAIDMAIEALSAERTGEWIENDDFTCSECGYCMIVGGGAYNYCPNCGADMRENDYQRQIEDLEHNMRYEPTYNPEDGSM